LVTVNSATENNYVSNFNYGSSAGNFIWIGYYDGQCGYPSASVEYCSSANQPGAYSWVQGSSWYSNWQGPQPDLLSEICTQVNWNNVGWWNNMPCTSSLSYVCENCKAGYAKSNDPGASCALCPDGTYSGAGASACIPCPVGTYSHAGATTCKYENFVANGDFSVSPVPAAGSSLSVCPTWWTCAGSTVLVGRNDTAYGSMGTPCQSSTYLLLQSNGSWVRQTMGVDLGSTYSVSLMARSNVSGTTLYVTNGTSVVFVQSEVAPTWTKYEFTMKSFGLTMVFEIQATITSVGVAWVGSGGVVCVDVGSSGAHRAAVAAAVVSAVGTADSSAYDSAVISAECVTDGESDEPVFSTDSSTQPATFR